jgi:hypothetical protein
MCAFGKVRGFKSIVFCVFSTLATGGNAFSQSPSNWQFQIHGGLSQLAGDVSPRPGFGGGIAAQRNFSDKFALRLDYTGSMNYGLDTKTSQASSLNASLTYDYWKYYYGRTNKPFAANYRTALHQFSINPVFNIHQWEITAAGTVKMYGTAGYSYLLGDVDVNAIDAGSQPYDFGRIDFLPSRSAIRSELKNLLDKTYESNFNPNRTATANPNYIKDHGVNAGLGASYTGINRLGFMFEYRLTKPFSDYLDGISTGSKNEWIHYMHFGLSYTLAKNKRKITSRVSGSSNGLQTGAAVITTEGKLAEPTVFGTAMIHNSDTSYHLHIRYVPVVFGSSPSEEILFLRLSNSRLLVLPFATRAVRVPGSTEYEFTVKLTGENVSALAGTKVLGFKFESTGYIYEDKIEVDKQDAFSRIARQLLKVRK